MGGLLRRVVSSRPGLSLTLLLAVLALASGLGPPLALRTARPALLELGPTDGDYLRGFRPEWERDLRTRFHWASPSAAITLPLRIEGAGNVLRMRVRRHYTEPARVRLVVEGRTSALIDYAYDPKVAYRTLEVALPVLTGDRPFQLGIEVSADPPRPLGLAVDWVEVVRTSPTDRVVLLPRTRALLALVVLGSALAVLLAGGTVWAGGASGASLLGAALLGMAWDVVAFERILQHGAGLYLVALAVAVAVVRWRRSAEFLAIDSRAVAAGLVACVAAGAAIRLTLLLHPQFYYPDVKVHSLFVWQLARRGIAPFLADFIPNQFRYSLGLQLSGAHWYAFPYPPLFYLLCWPLVRLGVRPEVAVLLLPAAVNALEALLVFGIARAFGRPSGTALAAAAAVPLLPIFLARLCLAYFPAIVGHAIDALLLLYLARHRDDLGRPVVVLRLAALLALALLAYTQAMLNFAIILGGFLLLRLLRDRSREGRRAQAGLVVAGVLGGALSFGLFYWRYVPMIAAMHRQEAVAEEPLALERLARGARSAQEEAEPEEPDPYVGPDVNPWRGLRKAAWRVYVFYGWLAPVLVAGTLVFLFGLTGSAVDLAAVWAAAYLLLNLASGGLPGPNLVRYNKDLEIVAPLVCIGLAEVGARLWTLSRALAGIYGLAYVATGASRAVGYLTERFSLER